VAGATLLCDRYVSILTGPVVGLVTGDTARILLEVDRTAEITCHVCLVDESCPQGREVQRVKSGAGGRASSCALSAPDATIQVFLPDRLWAMLEKGIDLHSETRHRHCVCVCVRRVFFLKEEV